MNQGIWYLMIVIIKKKAFVFHEQIKTSQTDTNQRGGNDLNIKLIFLHLDILLILLLVFLLLLLLI